MATTMVADPEARPEVFPTDRLMENGMARPELRHDLRRIDNVRNAVTVVSVWFWVAVIIGGAVWIDRWWAYLAAFVLMGPMYARFAILMHEAAHKLLFTNKRANDWVGTWLIAYPTWTPISIYRRGHFAHHKEEFGPREPDMAFYGGYRCDRRTLARRLVRDAVGISGWKNFTPLFKALRILVHPSGGRRPSSAMQVVLWAVHVGGHRAVVDLSPAVVAAVDDPVAGDQPAAGHRRARRAAGRRRPAGDHPQRPAVAGAPGSGSSPTTRAGTWPTMWTWVSRSAISPPSTPSWSGPATSPRGSPTPTTGRCGGRWPRPDRPPPTVQADGRFAGSVPVPHGPDRPSSCPGRGDREAASALRAGASWSAMALPSSTPHWSNESMPHTAPSVNTVCS